jgi:dolichol-phosphate mannosyltransferase
MGPEVALSIVIPAYLEEENLRLLLPRLKTVVGNLGVATEILVVDTDPALDRTAEVCAEIGVTHLKREHGADYGCAVKTGIRASRGRWVLFMDADGSHAPEFIARLWEQAEGHDIVIASRYVEGGVTENPRILQWMSLLLNKTYIAVLGLDCKDASNSFKLYRGAPLRSLSLTCRNFDIVEEILVRYGIVVPGARIKEIPFAFKKRMFGETKRNLFAFIGSFAVTLARLGWIRISQNVRRRRDAQKQR